MTTKERYELMQECGKRRTRDLRFPSFVLMALIAVLVASQGFVEAYLTVLLTCFVVLAYLIGEKR